MSVSKKITGSYVDTNTIFFAFPPLRAHGYNNCETTGQGAQKKRKIKTRTAEQHNITYPVYSFFIPKA